MIKIDRAIDRTLEAVPEGKEQAQGKELIQRIKCLSDEQRQCALHVIRLIKSLSDEQADKAMQLLKNGMTLNELDALIENGGIPA